MAKARAIIRRRKAVQNIRKITQTMQLIATARYQKCLQRATASKPYTEKISEMVRAVVQTDSVQSLLRSISGDEDDRPRGAADRYRVLRVLQPNDGVARSILLVLTANRGLCGSYNTAVLRAAMDERAALCERGIEPAVEMVGKKGVNYFRFLRQPIERSVTDVEDRIAYARVAEMADRYIADYVAGRVARVDVAYMQFHSVGVQKPAVEQLLPIEPPSADGAAEADGGGAGPTTRVDYEFSPPPADLLARLIPETIRVRLYQFFNDAIVSEQVARMVAMKAATDAAGDMIKYLGRQYNRARQTQITMELLDILGGVEALK